MNEIKYTYYPMTMHIHAGNQIGASFESHMYNAYKLGMKYIRYTGHDVRTGRKQYPVESFDFSKGTLRIDESENRYHEWTPGGNIAYSFSDGALSLSCTGSGGASSGSLTFFSSGKRHSVSLLASLTLFFDISCVNIGKNSRIIIDFTLSQRPPEHKDAHIKFVYGNADGLEADRYTEYEFLPSLGSFEIALSDIMKKHENIGGLDNAFATVSIVLEAAENETVQCRFKKYETKVLYHFDDVVRRQRALAEKIGEKYGVFPFVTTEISGAGQHKNCFTSAVPVLNYEEYGYNISAEQAIEHVKKYGGIFSYNHPFEKYKRMTLTDDEAKKYLDLEAKTLTENKVFGAAVLEVGFPEGRHGFTFSQHAELWDRFSLSGIFITADGDSDSHFSDEGWLDGNNFCTWTAAPSDMKFPVPEDAFTDSLKAGRAYSGDPTRFSGTLDFKSEDNTPIGGVIKAEKGSKTKLYFDIDGAKSSWTLCIIKNGKKTDERPIISDSFSYEFELESTLPVSFARIEIYDKNGRCVLFTNPIYLINEDFTGDIPKERIY